MTLARLVVVLVVFMIAAVIIMIATVIGLCAVIGVVSDSQPELSDLEGEVAVEGAKSLMQLIVVIFIGGAITALFKAYQHSREERTKEEQRLVEEDKLRSQVRIDYLARVGEAYRDAKGTRRALRAGGITTKFNNPPSTLTSEQIDTYAQQMTILNKAQLDLEALRIEAESLPALLGLEELPNLLKDMEGYLREVVREFEKVSAGLISSNSSVDFAELDRLAEFSGPSTADAGIRKQFSSHHRQVIQLITSSTTDVLSA